MNVESLPPNIEEIIKFAEEIKLDVKYLLGEMYCGDLWMGRVKALPENITFNVGGWLCLQSVEIIHSSVQFVNFWCLIIPEDRKVKIIW